MKQNKMFKKSKMVFVCALTALVCFAGPTGGGHNENIGITTVHAAENVSQASTKVLEIIKKSKPVNTTTAKPAPNIKIMVNNKPATLTDPIVMDNGRVFLPLRSLGDLLNINVDYIANIKVAKAQNAKAYLELPLGYNQAVKNKTLILPIDTFNKNTRIISYNSRTYLPVRFISENLGYQISYGNNTVSITTDGTVPVIPDKPTEPTKPTKPTTPKPVTPVTTPDSEWMNPSGSKTPPTYNGKKEGEISKDGNWEWGQPEKEWFRRDPNQQGGIIDVGPIDINGPSNGNWN